MTTYLLQADLDLSHMAKWAAQEEHSDPDRALHCMLYRSFTRQHVPRAFVAITDNKGPRHHAKLYAYTKLDMDALRNIARRHQEPEVAAIMSPFTLETKEMPEEWQEGSTVGFRIRLRPTYRDTNTKAEKDISMRGDVVPGTPLDQIYCEWLSNLLAKKAGAQSSPEQMRVTSYQRRTVKRQESSNWSTAADVTIEGSCKILDPEAWKLAVRIGIGRHRPYGYGMLLLRPAGQAV